MKKGLKKVGGEKKRFDRGILQEPAAPATAQLIGSGGRDKDIRKNRAKPECQT